MSTALTVLDTAHLLPSVPGKTPEQMMLTLRRNLAGGNIQASDLHKIVVPVGSSAYFTILGEPKSNFEAVIVGVQPGRRCYANPMKPGQPTTPPDCISTDLLTGVGTPGGSCLKCPNNAWGSARPIDGQPQRGKACGEYRWVFVRIPDDDSVFPTILQVPVTSLKAFRQYFAFALGATYDPWQVMTHFTLVPGNPVPTINFEIASVLPEAVAVQLANYQEQMSSMIEGLALLVMTEADTEVETVDETVPY
jgi:hypothetical protein